MKTCPQCQQPMRDDAPEGLCPACLLREAAGGVESGSEATVLLGASQSASPRSGDTLRYFGNYELLEEVGVGGMGVVWKARQASLNRIVALKMIRGGILANAEEVKRFHAEAQAAANLQHPNIVAIHEIGEQDGQHYYSMDFIRGRSLHALCDGKPLEPERAARLLATVAGAVEFAHRAHILHRDLKPHNVMMDAEGVPHLTDFGLAKRMDVDSGMTQTGAIMGSPSYMAPEQAQGRNDAVGPRTDVYSLGAILYETLTGRPPFQAATALDTVRQVVDAEPAPPRSVNPGAPADLETICLKCLEKEPARRYASAQEFSDELGRFLRHEPIHARPIGVVGRAVKWARRKPVIASLVLGNAATILAIVIGQFIANAKLQKSYDALEQAEATAKDQLAWSQLRQAKVIRTSDQPARRAQALALLKSAADLEARPRSAHTQSKHELPSPAELRTEAVAALLTEDATIACEMRVTAVPGAVSMDRDGRQVLGAWMRILDADKAMKGDASAMRSGIAVQDIAAKRELLRIDDRQLFQPGMSISPDGKMIAFAVAEKKDGKVAGYRIDLRDIASNTVTRTLAWPEIDPQKTTPNATVRLFFSPDGTLLGAVRGATNTEIIVWNLAASEGRVIDYAKGLPHWLAFTPDSKHVVFKTAPQKLERRTLADGARFEITLPQPATGAAVMDQSGTTFLIATGITGKPGGALLGLDWHSGAQVFSIPLAHEPRSAAAFGPDMRVAFSDGPDLAIYDITTGRVTLHMPDVDGALPVDHIAWGSDAKFITSISQDGVAKRWELSLNPLIKSLRS
ncbi:MAG: serine/threonine-protein kinase, partial [Chthoniobacteraceae bacterium]